MNDDTNTPLPSAKCRLTLTCLGAAYLALFDAAKAGKLPGGLDGVDRIMAILEPELRGWDEAVRTSLLRDLQEGIFHTSGLLELDRSYLVECGAKKWTLRSHSPFGLQVQGDHAFLCVELLGGESR